MADRVVADRFRLIEPLGRGGMGTVWRAEDQVLGRTVAIKEVSLPPSLPDSEREAVRERVLREARAAARLSHSSAVTVYDVLEEGDYTFIAMEMVDSPTLAEVVDREGPLSPERAAFIGLKLLDTLSAAHAKGIVHRDVKPANVMVSDRAVKLADFGIASVKGDPHLTATGLLLGSPSYMSPEQVSGERAGPASDLWALGATLFFAVEGQGPFDRDGPLPTLMAISNDPVPEPSHAGPLGPAIKALLEKDPAHRATAEDVRSIIEPIAALGEPESPLVAEVNGTPVDGTPSAAGAVLPPAAPAGLAALLGGGDSEETDDEAPAPPPQPTEPPPRPADALAAVPDMEATWEDELPEPAAATMPVAPARPTAPTQVERQPAAPPPAVPAGDRRSWVVAAGVVALLLLAFLLVPRLLSSPDGQEPSATGPTDQPAGAAEQPTGSTGQPAGSTGGTAPESTPEANSEQPAAGNDDSEEDEDAEEPDTAGGAAAGDVPSGWRRVALGNTGYSIAAPRGWSTRSNALGDGSSVRFNGPDGKYLLVDWTNDPGEDALQAWEQQASSFAQRHSNYREIRLEETEFKNFPTAAMWEWTYTSRGANLHAANLGFANDSYGFALNFQTRADDWESSEDEYEAFQESFGRSG
ncbi:MAG TPA: serine/threonine-protein kinase [Actinomycetota bacterium]|nr:serine/threonine-protein kinase [Actinomycetota bacterium]